MFTSYILYIWLDLCPFNKDMTVSHVGSAFLKVATPSASLPRRAARSTARTWATRPSPACRPGNWRLEPLDSLRSTSLWYTIFTIVIQATFRTTISLTIIIMNVNACQLDIHAYIAWCLKCSSLLMDYTCSNVVALSSLAWGSPAGPKEGLGESGPTHGEAPVVGPVLLGEPRRLQLHARASQPHPGGHRRPEEDTHVVGILKSKGYHQGNLCCIRSYYIRLDYFSLD